MERPRVNLLANAVMWPTFLLMSAVTVVLGVAVGTITAPFDRARRAVAWVDHLVWGRLLFLFGPLWSVRRSIPPLGPGPYVVVSNHGSLIDIPLNMGLPLPMRVLAREGLFRVPVMGWYMRYSRQILVDGSSRDGVDQTLDACRDAIANGVSVLVFPEGTRTEDGAIGVFHKGAFKLAAELGVPVLPVVIDGSHQALPKGSPGLVLPYCRFRMRALEPIPVDGTVATRVLARRVRDRMVAELDRMRAEGGVVLAGNVGRGVGAEPWSS
ncbi:MAG: lysophospholipid acyltransferase family protein [Myxococcota bacterium]